MCVGGADFVWRCRRISKRLSSASTASAAGPNGIILYVESVRSPTVSTHPHPSREFFVKYESPSTQLERSRPVTGLHEFYQLGLADTTDIRSFFEAAGGSPRGHFEFCLCVQRCFLIHSYGYIKNELTYIKVSPITYDE